MKTTAAVLLMILLAAVSHSQSSDPRAEALAAIKANNSAILEKQQKTLELLDQLHKEATAVKLYSKRS